MSRTGKTRGCGLSALETGVFFLPAALALMIGAIAAGRLVGTVGTRPVAVASLALVAIGNGLLVGVPAGENVGCWPAMPASLASPGQLAVCCGGSMVGRTAIRGWRRTSASLREPPIIPNVTSPRRT